MRPFTRIYVERSSKNSGNEIMSIDDSDIYHCYVDLLKGPSERFAMAYQGIGKDNMLKHTIGAADAATNEEAITTAFGKRFSILLDFELLESHMHFYQEWDWATGWNMS